MATSPAASGPAGSQFEGQVGASYLLCMLAGAEPRGLPGTIIEQVKFQRGDEGHPLDDVIVHAKDQQGNDAVLEIQVKRSITFTPNDKVFKKVVGQIAEAAAKPGFWSSRIELAIATTSVSKKLHGAYQDVLRWAREIGSASVFMDRILRKGSGSNDMRTFVSTFKDNLHAAGSPIDDVTVWQLLKRLQILNFDFTSEGSAQVDLAKERASRILHLDQNSRAGALWSALVQQAIDIAKDGGDRNSTRLREDLHQLGYQLEGDPSNSNVREVLAEASRHALDDISDRVGNVFLTRQERISLVREALNGQERYIEIRGDAGVGKSALLKHFAKLASEETTIIVLNPERTARDGGIAFRNSLGYSGTVKELMSDLAADGGAILFVDNLDGFNKERQLTVCDLVSEAAKIPSFRIMTTARSHFGIDEPSWLPKEAIETLGQAAPIFINELSVDEVKELSHLDPTLAELLADRHKARDVARNLFRLGRLVEMSSDEPIPRTETDMSEQWWQTADGKRAPAEQRRERARLLKALAKQALQGDSTFDVSEAQPGVIEALKNSGTLSELQPDIVSFRHDVLREWAIANLLFQNVQLIDQLPLKKPASTVMARAVELVARQTLERNPSEWTGVLDKLSEEEVHKSWRRPILLALVRSEIGAEVLSSVRDELLNNRAELLRELIRTVMAVEVSPASQMFTSADFEFPDSLYIPNSPSFYRLVDWIIHINDEHLYPVIPDIVQLYEKAILRTLGLDARAKVLIIKLYQWLKEIEVTGRAFYSASKQLFNGEIASENLRTLVSELRTYFLLFCHLAPDQAKDYLNLLRTRSYGDPVIREVIMTSGALTKAAPIEFSELVADALIIDPGADDSYPSYERRAFSHLDSQFLPVAPSKGPFLQLLQSAPEQGLLLIRKLVDHAITQYSQGQSYGSNVIAIEFPNGKKEFPWEETYLWSRQGSDHYAITTALMALETWAHDRIEKGDEFEVVLNDVLGPDTSAACYLLVAVDLILSHWPASRDLAVPFVSCPELLSIERMRIGQEGLNTTDLWGARRNEIESASLEKLKKRASRHCALEHILSHYVLFEPFNQRDEIERSLKEASKRLPAVEPDDDFRDPSFMTVHALNCLDANNYSRTVEKKADGTEREGWQYIAPESEEKHLNRLLSKHNEQTRDTAIPLNIGFAIEDPSRITDEFIDAAVSWAQEKTASDENEDTDGADLRADAIVGAAMIAMRDGNENCQNNNQSWARQVFNDALEAAEDSVHRHREGLRFNPPAIAFVGLVHILMGSDDVNDIPTLLEIVAKGNPAVSHGFIASINTLEQIDERLPRSILRCSFASCIRPRRSWETSDEEKIKQDMRSQERLQSVVDAELSWLNENGPEPSWPKFVPEKPSVRRGIRIPVPGEEAKAISVPNEEEKEEEFTDHQAAALWLNAAKLLLNEKHRPWLIELIESYSSWTASTNGAGLNKNAQLDHEPYEWNLAYYDLLAKCFNDENSLKLSKIIKLSITELPDEAFFDVVANFLRSVDEIYFNEQDISTTEVLNIRATLYERIEKCHDWQRLKESTSFSVERHLSSAVATMLFNSYAGFGMQPPKSYLLEKGIDQLPPFLPQIQKMVLEAPCPFVAILALDLFEVSPRVEHLPILLKGALAWLNHMPDNTEFWVGHNIGRRFCTLVTNFWQTAPDRFTSNSVIRQNLDTLLAALVRLGVAEASQLEALIAR